MKLSSPSEVKVSVFLKREVHGEAMKAAGQEAAKTGKRVTLSGFIAGLVCKKLGIKQIAA